MKKIIRSVFAATMLLLFTLNASSQIKMIIIGNSVSQGTLDTAYLHKYNYNILKSWRYPFWVSMDSITSLKFDLIGSLKKLHKQGDSAAHYPKSPYTSHVFDSAHEARWGASSDSILRVLKANPDKDTADIALIHIGGSDNDTNIIKTVKNIDTIIYMLRVKNPFTAIFLAKVVGGGAINDSIASLAAGITLDDSPVTLVDLATGWNKNTMALDTVVPDSTGEKFIARKFFNAINNLDFPTTLTSPSGLKQFEKTIYTIGVSWKKSIAANPDIYSGYNVYVNDVKVNRYLIKDTNYIIRNLAIFTPFNIKVSSVDYRTNTEKFSSTQSYLTAGYTVTFTVNYNSNPVQGAKVSFNSKELLTDVNGKAIFTDVAPGQRTYQIQKTGFLDINSTYQNIQSDTYFTINMKSIGMEDENSNVEIFPIPSNGLITIKGAPGAVAEICDLQGNVLSFVICKDDVTTCDLSSLAAGMYTVKIKNNQKEIVKKIIIE